jgi:arylformamidase
MSRLYDITPPITERMNVWPGDTPPTREILCDMATGANITLSTIRTTTHLGAHADGPNHYAHPAPGIGERSLDHYLGPCILLDATIARARRVGIEHIQLPSGPLPPRVLIRTNTFPDPTHWNADFAALAPELIDVLAARRVITIGIDTPSVDLQDSKDLPTHHAVARHDMAILEGLALAGVPAGEYELIALPLKLMGFDASPVRAVLRTR